jgi:hypothetical protein
MNYVYLSPHFPPNYYLFCTNLARLGATVLGLGDDPYEGLRPELRGNLADYYRVADMHNYDDLLRACGYFTHRFGKIHRLDSHTEYWMETEARLRTDFNVPGPRINDMAQFKRKSMMKATFERAGVTSAPGRICETLREAQVLVAETGYPLVAKPDIGVGAANTYRLNDDGDLERFFATKPPMDFLLEAFVHGAICTFDGLADKEGNPVFIGSLQYSQGIMETVNEDRDIYFWTQREIPADLEEAGRRVLKEFEIRERFFHLEFFRRPDGGLTALEINVRPPGGPALDMYNYACEVDLYWGWANVILNNRFLDRYTRKYHCCYVSRRFNKPYIHSHEQILLALDPIIAHHERMPDVFAGAMGDYAYLLRTADFDEMLAAVRFIQEQE